MTQAQDEVLTVGYDFKAGVETDTDIDSLLGNQTTLFEGRSIRCDDSGCYEAPKYSQDPDLTLEKLKELKVNPIIFPASPYSKRKTRRAVQSSNHQYVAFFVFGGEQCVTIPFESEAEALACVLWYVLAYFY